MRHPSPQKRIYHFIDQRRAVGVRLDDKGRKTSVKQYPVICDADIVETTPTVGVTSEAGAVTCGKCASIIDAGRLTTTWKIDGRDVEIPVPVSSGVAEAQARYAERREAQERRAARAGRRITPDA